MRAEKQKVLRIELWRPIHMNEKSLNINIFWMLKWEFLISFWALPAFDRTLIPVSPAFCLRYSDAGAFHCRIEYNDRLPLGILVLSGTWLYIILLSSGLKRKTPWPRCHAVYAVVKKTALCLVLVRSHEMFLNNNYFLCPNGKSVVQLVFYSHRLP